ncbi:Peptidyl-tRNA hydrolase [Cladophialophora carrionii]|uniref:peptidyl-tRNA hydrolase n=1 Tax=Cladophialophora carrionii TaxID=86049 RepID=A0A1C1CPF1_9EURO|nr:Peptidyl-tRNA hydrolase [Cladophialophora carrionii]
MADRNQPQPDPRQHPRPTSQLQSHLYNQYRDPDQDLFWPEPVDQVAFEAAAQIEPELQPQPSPPTPRQDVVKRRPVKPIISHSPPPPIDAGNKPILSPIIPSPLRIRRLKVPSPTMRSVRLLIASLGNPPPYHSTRHSVGHIVLKHVASHLGLPSLTKSKLLGSGLVSSGVEVGLPQYTLWQSASMINISGQGTLKAWKAFINSHPASEDVATALIILHDELESSLGAIKLRRGESSPKGHNGIKSVQSSLKSAGLLSTMGDRFIKIGVGIGRPVSREKDDVSAWVLGQLTGAEKAKIEGTTESLAAVLKSEIARLERS